MPLRSCRIGHQVGRDTEYVQVASQEECWHHLIESESMSLIRERVAGPTEHRLLELDLSVECEAEIDPLGRSEKLRCWRDAK